MFLIFALIRNILNELIIWKTCPLSLIIHWIFHSWLWRKDFVAKVLSMSDIIEIYGQLFFEKIVFAVKNFALSPAAVWILNYILFLMAVRMHIRDLSWQWWTSAGHFSGDTWKGNCKTKYTSGTAGEYGLSITCNFIIIPVKIKRVFRGGWAKSSKESALAYSNNFKTFCPLILQKSEGYDFCQRSQRHQFPLLYAYEMD